MGAVLAGGAGRRLGGSKATAELAGRPLIAYPLAAFAEAGIEAVVVAKPATLLPPLDVGVLREPPEPLHPLLGVVTALAHAAGRPVIACPCDTPFVTATLLAELAACEDTAVACDGTRLHPLLARYGPSALPVLEEGLAAGRSASAAAERLRPALIEAGALATFNVNTQADLRSAAARLE